MLGRGTRWGTDMRKLAAGLFGVAAGLVTGGSGWAAIEVEVVEAWPAGDAVTIGTNQNYYLRIAYRTDEPAHIWARPWFQGRELATGSHPSPEYEAGSGEALGWFFIDPGQQVDEVRIRAGAGSPNRTTQVAAYLVRGVAGGATADGTDTHA